MPSLLKRHWRHASGDSVDDDTGTSHSGHGSPSKTTSSTKKLRDDKHSRSHRRHQKEEDYDSGSSSSAEPSDAHMAGSRFQPTDICPSCDAPRGSCAVCPVSHYHHGTDQPVPVASAKKKGGVAGLIGKLRKHSRTTSGVGSTSASSLPPLAPESGKSKSSKTHNADGDKHHRTSKRDATHGSDSATAAVGDATEAAAAEVQYYCYTDDAGNTYYYAANEAAAEPSAETARHDAHTSAPAAAATPFLHEQEPVCYQYVDEDGTTKYYYAYPDTSAAVQTPEPQVARTSSAGEGHHRTAKAHGRHAETPSAGAEDEDAGSTGRDDDGSKSHRDEHRSAGKRGSRLMSLFKKKRSSRANLSSDDGEGESPSRRFTSSSSTEEGGKGDHKHKKPSKSSANKGESAKKKKTKHHKKDKKRHSKDAVSEASVSGPSDEDGTESSEYQGELAHSDSGAHRNPGDMTRHASASALDAAIAARAREIERNGGSDARKRFEKDLRRAVKELEETEKSERRQLSRQRKVFTEDLARQKRAIACEMRCVERRVDRAVQRSEPQ